MLIINFEWCLRVVFVMTVTVSMGPMLGTGVKSMCLVVVAVVRMVAGTSRCNGGCDVLKSVKRRLIVSMVIVSARLVAMLSFVVVAVITIIGMVRSVGSLSVWSMCGVVRMRVCSTVSFLYRVMML